jgi:indolepyruvate ferredoxin oxidoreductase alpha subunit
MANPTPAGTDDCGTLARALTWQLDAFFTVTGQPVTHLIDQVGLIAARTEGSINEKTAVEAAMGLAAVGGRAGVIVKHCGFAYALDSLANAAVHGTGGALVVIAGDDCDASHSTRIFDSRQLAETAGLPVVDLALDGDADEVVAVAVHESEVAHVPVVVRVTARLHANCRDAVPPSGVPVLPGTAGPPRSQSTLDTKAAHTLTKLGRHQRHRLITIPQLRTMHAQPPMLRTNCGSSCAVGIVVSGAAAHCLPPGMYCRLTAQGIWPLPPAVIGFARQHQRTLVLEEPGPYLESALSQHADGMVLGRLTGHLPPEGSLSTELISSVLDGKPPRTWATIASKGPAQSSPAPYAVLFEAVARLERTGAFVAADVGSSVKLCYPPYRAASVALSLGSAIGVAGGAARAGRQAIAVIGDYGLTHSGLEALLECGRLQLPVLVLVLDNGVQAQTGGQPVPRADRMALVRACGIPTVLDWLASDTTATFDRLAALIRDQQPAVVLVRNEN